MLHNVLRHPAVWVCNLILVGLSLLSILGYFMLPFWSVAVSFTLTPETVEEALGDLDTSELGDIDVGSIVGDGIDFDIRFAVNTSDLVKSFDSDQANVLDNLVGDNVNRIVGDLTDKLFDVAKNVLRVTAGTVIREQVKEGVKEALSQLSDEEVQEKLDNAGVTDEYIDEKTQELIDTIYDGGATVDELSAQVVDIVDETFAKMKASGDSDFADMELTEADKESMRQSVEEIIVELADENGNIDPNELIATLLLKALEAADEGGGSASAAGEVALLAADGSDGTSDGSADSSESATEQLRTKITEMVRGYIPEEVNSYIVLALRVLAGLLLFSFLPWVYILIKILVKFLKGSENPTVKLKCPIWLGWLPFLLLSGVPSLAIWIVMTFMPDLLVSLELPAEVMSAMEGLSLSSSGVFAAVSALICFGISIFFMVARKKIKRQNAEREDD